MLIPLFLLILMPAGFIGSAWITNSVFDFFRRDVEQITNLDRLGTLIVLAAVFGSYCYFICKLLVER